MILYPVTIEICFAFESQDNKLKRSPDLPRLLVSMLGVKRLNSVTARKRVFI